MFVVEVTQEKSVLSVSCFCSRCLSEFLRHKGIVTPEALCYDTPTLFFAVLQTYRTRTIECVCPCRLPCRLASHLSARQRASSVGVVAMHGAVYFCQSLNAFFLHVCACWGRGFRHSFGGGYGRDGNVVSAAIHGEKAGHLDACALLCRVSLFYAAPAPPRTLARTVFLLCFLCQPLKRRS